MKTLALSALFFWAAFKQFYERPVRAANKRSLITLKIAFEPSEFKDHHKIKPNCSSFSTFSKMQTSKSFKIYILKGILFQVKCSFVAFWSFICFFWPFDLNYLFHNVRQKILLNIEGSFAPYHSAKRFLSSCWLRFIYCQLLLQCLSRTQNLAARVMLFRKVFK